MYWNFMNITEEVIAIENGGWVIIRSFKILTFSNLRKPKYSLKQLKRGGWKS
jgi:hypothetical protein